MPQNVALAALIFGAVLFLLALTGGRFKLFGAELSATVGRGPRILAGVAGLALIVFGLRQSMPNSPAPQPASQAASSATRSSGTDAGPPVATQTSEPEASVPVAQGGGAPAQASSAPPESQAALPAGVLSDTEDSVQILDISPAPGSFLQRGQPHQFRITVAYSLQSADAAILSMSVAQIRNSAAGCNGDGNLTDATEIGITRGKRTANLDLTWSGDDPRVSKQAPYMEGFISFMPMFWQSINGKRGERIRNFGMYKSVCLRFGT